jgi:XTP/dITP diphosphohydrolase
MGVKVTRKFVGNKLVLASHNKGKLAEIAAVLAPAGVELIGAGLLNLPEPEETGATCLENALIKARAAVAASSLPALADDTGLEIAALDGWPGVITADIGGPERDHELAMARILERLDGNADTSARFVTVLALCWPDGHVETAEGEVRGRLVHPGRGARGWGYDPYFLPDGETRVFAELAPGEKNALSHRARAVRALYDKCFT